jgi:sugar/nucleoside kinase (ribokinase family)
MKKKYNIVSIGHVTNDFRIMMGVRTPFVGGAAFFSPHAAKRSGADVLVITKMAEKDKGCLSLLTDQGIDVISLPSRATTSIENIFLTEDQDNRKLNLLSLADSFSAEEIPSDIEADVFHIAALFNGEVPDEMIKKLSARGRSRLIFRQRCVISVKMMFISRTGKTRKNIFPIHTISKLIHLR